MSHSSWTIRKGDNANYVSQSFVALLCPCGKKKEEKKGKKKGGRKKV
jgi:hypothetical protein